MSEKLLPCPFCGKAPKCSSALSEEGAVSICFECPEGCSVSKEKPTYDEAVAIWNTRHGDAPQALASGELRVLCRLAWNGWTDSEHSRNIIAEHEARDTPSRDAWDRVIAALDAATRSAPAAGCPLPSGEVGLAETPGYAGADAPHSAATTERYRHQAECERYGRGGGVRRAFFIIVEPGKVPAGKGPFITFDQVEKFARDAIEHHPDPDTHIIRCELTWNDELWVQCAREQAEIDAALDRVDWDAVDAELARNDRGPETERRT